MLLDHFDNNPKFLEEGKSLTIKFKKEIITLQLATDQGCQPLEDELMVGEWKLTPEDNLTVGFACSVPDNDHFMYLLYLFQIEHVGIHEGSV